jgi:hypothetical protein|tara:strand:+ start:161 stop:331 length:171 start_codon:yes stop_codon:yes gene_type:complete
MIDKKKEIKTSLRRDDLPSVKENARLFESLRRLQHIRKANTAIMAAFATKDNIETF